METQEEILEKDRKKERELFEREVKRDLTWIQILSVMKELTSMEKAKAASEHSEDDKHGVCFPSKEEARRQLCPCNHEVLLKETDEDPDEEDDTSEDIEEE